MASNCLIGLKYDDKNVNYVYCHNNGFPQHTGKILKLNYNDKEKIEELISLGDLSILEKNIHPSENSNHNFNNQESNVCVFYNRDRNEKNTDYKTTSLEFYLHPNFNSRYPTNYRYLYYENNWYIVENNTIKEFDF